MGKISTGLLMLGVILNFTLTNSVFGAQSVCCICIDDENPNLCGDTAPNYEPDGNCCPNTAGFIIRDSTGKMHQDTFKPCPDPSAPAQTCGDLVSQTLQVLEALER